MTDLRKLINLFEDPQLKKEIIKVVHATDDFAVLQRVLNTLKAGNIDDRIKSVIGKDGDAQPFLKKIVSAIISIESPIEEKNAFLDKYSSGSVINSSLLLDGKLHSLSELVGTGFSLELFKQLSLDLTSQGVGPCEVALAVLSPEIVWSGYSGGGGDIQVKKKAIEVKARASKGGRWINARKAKLDLQGIVTAIVENSNIDPTAIPDRINTSYWVDSIRPQIDPKKLRATAKKIADCTFKFVDNSLYQQALMSGDASAVVNSYLSTGYDNYKKYSAFAGMLLLDLPTEQLQYFVDYAEMNGNIGVGTTYIYAPESEMMPQVILAPGSGPVRAGKFKANDDALVSAKTVAERKKSIAKYAEQICSHYGVTDPETILQVANTITADLSHGVAPDKLPTRLMKVFPELGARKKSQVPPATAPTPPAQPNAAPVPVAGPASDELRFSESRRVPRGVSEPRRRR